MRRARSWLALLAIGIVLAVAFVRWVWGGEEYDPAIAIAELLSGLILLQLPAVAWRMVGGSFAQVLAAAILVPLIVAEIWLVNSVAGNSGSGGDLHGVEQVLMWVVIVPIVVSALIVGLLSRRLFPIAPPDLD